MTGDLIINNKDAFTTWGISMGDNFIQNILIPPPVKDRIENDSPFNHGKEVITGKDKIASRTLTLSFCIQGSTKTEYAIRFKSFCEELKGGVLNIKIPAFGSEVYKLLYLTSSSFGQNYARTFSKLSVKLEEPNPSNR